MDAPTYRLVNGIEIELTPEEVQEIVAEWEANDAALKNSFDYLVQQGYDTGQGWSLPIDDSSRGYLNEFRSQIKEGISLGAWTDASQAPIPILDTNGEPHQMTIAEVRQIIFLAGNYYAGLVARFR